MMELDLSYLPTEIPSSVCVCSLEQLLALSVSWLKYPIKNSSNHVLELGLELWNSSNGVVSFRPSRPGIWCSIMAVCRAAKCQNSRLTLFSVVDARSIWIIVRHVSSANPFQNWRPPGAAMMLERFDNVHQRAFPPINFLSNSEWNQGGRHP